MPSSPARTSRFPHKDKGLYGERDFNIGDEVWVAIRGNIMAFGAVDSCMQIQTSTHLAHYVFDGDPAVHILPQAATWPPKVHDEWLIGGKVWHAETQGRLVALTGVNGSFGLARDSETVLHSVDTPPELLFRFHV